MNLPNKTSKTWLSILIGVCAFFVIAGPRFLDPTNVAWLAGGDSLQHYLGWAFYRNSPWSWPLGLNPLYGMEFSNSIVFTDSIPLLAIPFKTITQFLPYPFQYLGIWVMLCFVLQSYFAFRLIGLITSNTAIQCFGSILFLFSPPLIFRLGLHESLMGHFIILAALYLNIKPAREDQEYGKKYKQSIAWILLLSIAVLTHFYLAVMVLVLWFANLCTRVFKAKSTSFTATVFETISLIVVAGFVAWQAGYFAIEGASGATRGFGDFRTNLLALFNSRGWSYWLKPIPLRDAVEAATGEGFQYLGAGSLFLLLSAVFALIKQKIQLSAVLRLVLKNYFFLIIALLLLALISFSNYIGFGPWNLRVPLPDFLLSILSIVRSSSRLFWPIYYTLLLIIIYVVLKAYSARSTLFLFGIAALLQVVDTSAGWLPIREKMAITASNKFKSTLQNPLWMAAGGHYRNIVINSGNENWGDLGNLASANSMFTNVTYLARVDAKKILDSFSKVNHQLHNGPLNQHSLYIFQDWKSLPDRIQFDPKKDLLARIDGVNILAPSWKVCNSCPQVSKELEISQLAPPLIIGQVVDFTKAGDGRANFMLGGWGFTEDWGTWATDSLAKVVLPMPNGEPNKLIIKANAFLSPQHAEQLVEVSINGIRIADQIVLKQAKGNTLEIKLPAGPKPVSEPLLIEFRSIDAISPMSAGLGPDERKLGIGLVSIQFAR